MAFFKRFSKKIDPAQDAARMRIRGWIEAALGSEPLLTLTISEIDCADPICPGIETIILVMREGEATQALKLRKAMVEAREEDVREAVKFL